MVLGKSCKLISSVFFGAALMVGCADSSTGPTKGPGSNQQIGDGDEVCETITFDNLNLSHGDLATSISALGTTLTIAAVAFDDAGGTLSTTPRIYNGTHVGGPDYDLEESDQGTSPVGPCPDCGPQGNMLIIQDTYEAPTTSDHVWGGTLTISGFSSGYYIKSYAMADLDNGEVPSQLWVNGTNIAGTQVSAANDVQTVNTTSVVEIPGSIMFQLGTAAGDGLTGSGAIDDIVVCHREQQTGSQGCTPGYWKNHTSRWSGTGYTTSTTIGSVFTLPSSLSSFSSMTFIQALEGGGGSGLSGATKILLRAAVAALLNAANTNVDYPRTTEEIIEDVNAALASEDRDTILELAADLDEDNNLGCPLN
jgi:hypothetical protein